MPRKASDPAPPNEYPEELIFKFLGCNLDKHEFILKQISVAVKVKTDKLRRQVQRLQKIGHITLVLKKGPTVKGNNLILSLTERGREFLEENGYSQQR